MTANNRRPVTTIHFDKWRQNLPSTIQDEYLDSNSWRPIVDSLLRNRGDANSICWNRLVTRLRDAGEKELEIGHKLLVSMERSNQAKARGEAPNSVTTWKQHVMGATIKNYEQQRSHMLFYLQQELDRVKIVSTNYDKKSADIRTLIINSCQWAEDSRRIAERTRKAAEESTTAGSAPPGAAAAAAAAVVAANNAASKTGPVMRERRARLSRRTVQITPAETRPTSASSQRPPTPPSTPARPRQPPTPPQPRQRPVQLQLVHAPVPIRQQPAPNPRLGEFAPLPGGGEAFKPWVEPRSAFVRVDGNEDNQQEMEPESNDPIEVGDVINIE